MDKRAHEGHRRLLAPCRHPCEPQGPVVLQPVLGEVEAYHALFLATWTVMWSTWRAVSESSAMKGAKYLVTPPKIARMTYCTTLGGARVLRHQWCTAARRSWCLRCREKSPRPAAAGIQVGDGVCRGYPVPWVFQVGAEAQVQARDSLRGGHCGFSGVELHAHHPDVCGHGLHALDEVLQRVGHHQHVVYIGLDEAPFGLSRRAQTVPLGLE